MKYPGVTQDSTIDEFQTHPGIIKTHHPHPDGGSVSAGQALDLNFDNVTDRRPTAGLAENIGTAVGNIARVQGEIAHARLGEFDRSPQLGAHVFSIILFQITSPSRARYPGQ